MLVPFRAFFTKSLEEEKVPDIWKVGRVSAIHKNRCRSKVENYRPFSLTSVPGKIMERLTRDQIVEHITDSLKKHGFISGKSGTAQLLEYLEDLTEVLDNGLDIDVVYLDFCKAFDKRLLKTIWTTIYFCRWTRP